MDRQSQAQRRQVTRARILTSADALFSRRGYDATSLDDIAEAADVAVRTIYLHFPSKAAMLLAYFDDWLDSFVRALGAQPVTLPVADAVEAALRQLTADGWPDRSYGEMAGPHPVVEFIGSGSPEIAGHIMHSWVRAMDELASDLSRRGDFSSDSLEPRARAAAIFAAWMATILAARQAPPDDATGNAIGVQILRALGNLS